MPRRKQGPEKESGRPTEVRQRPFMRRRGVCGFCKEVKEPDYKDVESLRRFVTDRGKIVGRNRSSLCQKHQKRMAVAVKRVRHLGLLPFVVQPG